MEERIRNIIAKELTRMGASEISFVVEWPTDLAHGDYAINAAMVASKVLEKSPREVAELLVPTLAKELGEDATKIEVAGPGFINITLAERATSRELNDAVTLGEGWGKNDAHEGKRILIEYSCPNPFKEMHIGHLLSTIIGESIARLLANGGAHVLRDSYGGDVGPHVAKALWALHEKCITEPGTSQEIGDAYVHGARAYEESEEVKAKIDELNVALYKAIEKDELQLQESDRELLELWRKGKDLALAAFRNIYRTLGTSFDYYFFESDVTPLALRIVDDALEKGIFQKSEGAIIYPGEKKGLHTLVFVTSRGTPTYEAKDIGLAFYKEERIETDTIIIETGSEQIGHFKVFLAALEEIAPAVARKMSHISHGLLTLTTGKMSSRSGNIITARELLQEVLSKAAERNTDPIVAEQVAVGALKYMILRSAPGGSIVFDPEKSLSLEGDSGPYLQYSLVRARSILAKAPEFAEEKTIEVPTEIPALARLITRFPSTAAKAEALRGPHILAQYLTQLAGEWNSFYAKEKIIGGTHELYSLSVARAFATTMQNGLELLGIPTPNEM